MTLVANEKPNELWADLICQDKVVAHPENLIWVFRRSHVDNRTMGYTDLLGLIASGSVHTPKGNTGGGGSSSGGGGNGTGSSSGTACSPWDPSDYTFSYGMQWITTLLGIAGTVGKVVGDVAGGLFAGASEMMFPSVTWDPPSCNYKGPPTPTPVPPEPTPTPFPYGT